MRTNSQLNTGLWVTSLYFIEGLPYTLVNIVSVALFKTMQVSNSDIGLFTSLFYIPWAIKFLWAPVIDYFGSKRLWIIGLQILLGTMTLLLSLCILNSQPFIILSLIFTIIAFLSATYDVACDGYYLNNLDKKEQALYIGWRNTAYKLAWLFGAGFLVYLAGQMAPLNIMANISANNFGWFVAFLLSALVFIFAAISHTYMLRKDIVSKDETTSRTFLPTFAGAFTSFFQQPHIALILFWILTFRTGDALLLKMAQPFLLETKAKGGLELSLSQVGFVYGSIGMICLLLGGIIGGWLVYKYGLRKCLFPTAILQSLTLLLYWLLAIMKPALFIIALANAFEQFAYGLAVAAYTSYLFTIVKEKFLASHYAIATGIMAIGMIIPGAVSGYLVDAIGYKQFFLISFFCSFPGILCTLKLPYRNND